MFTNYKMTSAITARKPQSNRWMNNYISPGVVGMVGDVNLQEEYKTSMPDLPKRYSAMSRGPAETKFGSNVQNGQCKGYDNGGMMARTIDRYWDSTNPYLKTNHGWIYQDLRAPDRSIEPMLGATPQYSWLNRVASVYNARSTGNKFLPAPGEYASKPGDVPRGGLIPRIQTYGDVSDPVNTPVFSSVTKPI